MARVARTKCLNLYNGIYKQREITTVFKKITILSVGVYNIFIIYIIYTSAIVLFLTAAIHVISKVAEKVELISAVAEDDDAAAGIAQHDFPKNLCDISRLL